MSVLTSRMAYFVSAAMLFLFVFGCAKAPEVAMPNHPVVKIEGIATMPVQVSVDYFSFSDGGSSTVGFGNRVYFIGGDGFVELENISDGHDGFRVEICNPTQRKIAIVLYDGEQEVARRKSVKRGETISLDVGRCKAQESPAELVDFPLEDEDRAQVEKIGKFLQTQDASLLYHDKDSSPGLAKGIAEYVNQAVGKWKKCDPLDWVRIEFGEGREREVKGVAEFEDGTLIVSVRIQEDGKEYLRVQPSQPEYARKIWIQR